MNLEQWIDEAWEALLKEGAPFELKVISEGSRKMRVYVFIRDRKKDMILRGGENIFCAEIEATLFRHPAVSDVCAFGVADDRLGEEVGAVVVLERGRQASTAELRDHMKALVAAFKVPRYIWMLDKPLPRNATGKILRRELRARLAVADAV